jgi:hypothetical protein
MRITQTSSSRGVSVPPPNATQMRLQGRWLLLARGTWIALVFPFLPLFIPLSFGFAMLRGVISQDNGVAIVLSTLAIYVLFQPLRRRLQAIIDRRFYRRKYDAARTLAAFSATLRNEVDLHQLRDRLVDVVEETMQPSHVSLWLRPPEPSRKRNTWLLARIAEEA